MLGERSIELVDCPECGFPAFVEHRFAVRSTEGPVPHAVTMCVQLHRLCTPEPQAVAEPHGLALGTPSIEHPPSRDAAPDITPEGTTA
jgi:hypothetical protein